MRISVSIGDPKRQPDGLNSFITGFTKYLESLGHTILYDLTTPPVDLIFLTHSSQDIISHQLNSLKKYLSRHNDALIVHRINICDEHIGYKNENEKVLEINNFAGYTVFISSFLRDLYAGQGFDKSKAHSVILNGADEHLFNPYGRSDWKQDERLRVITHHWSSAYTKGFDIYERFDLLLGMEPFSDLFEFTFVGNMPKGLHFKNTKVVSPLYGNELANAIRMNHIYLTASRNEAAGMHHIEGMCCGLPVLYLNSGALPEYCCKFGIEFNLVNFEEKLLKMRESYHTLRERVLSVPYKANWTASQYETLFCKLLRERK